MSSKIKPPLRQRGLFDIDTEILLIYGAKLVFEYDWMRLCGVCIHVHELRSEIDAYALYSHLKTCLQESIHIYSGWHADIRRLAKTCVRIWHVSAVKFTAHSAVMFFAPASAVDG